MFWPFRRRKQFDERMEPVLRFIGEQDGPTERTLKSELTTLLARRKYVKRAYLTQAIYRQSKTIEIVLAVVGGSEFDPQLVNDVAQVFGPLFDRKAHLDVVFLTSEQEQEAACVCNPFYVVP